MTLTATQLELPYFIPTSENVQQILSAVRASEAEPTAKQDEHFHLSRNRQAKLPWRWEGAQGHEHLKSQRNFKTQAEALADAKAKIKP